MSIAPLDTFSILKIFLANILKLLAFVSSGNNLVCIEGTPDFSKLTIFLVFEFHRQSLKGCTKLMLCHQKRQHISEENQRRTNKSNDNSSAMVRPNMGHRTGKRESAVTFAWLWR
ncbi:MAG: hypothetical protein EZS28_046884 [Streblomastix strix]|uniref:Uncharacterized protein n=1 Tax=Streblomastix strix TaxID=222440 RepID=A0A5J4TIK1_9EUKA|nr:MAG: hypothetical protein EZS28_046884 [Streblomastix strix]